MAKKKKEALRQIHYPSSAEYPEGRIEELYTDGTKEFIDKNGKPINLNALVISDAQLELWRKEPKEQALKEALELFKAQGMDVAEQRVKLEIIKFISELQGALRSTLIQPQAIIVEINMGSEKRIINATKTITVEKNS